MRSLRHFLLIAFSILLAGCSGEQVYRAATQAERTLYGLEHRAVQVADITMHYYEGGDPRHPTVVLVHGFTADKDNWPRFARHLLDDYHVLIPDLAGHGDSTWDPALDYSMPAQAARVKAFIDRLETGPVHLAGNSMGGFLTATFAVHYPESVRSIALLDAAGVHSPQPSPMDERVAQGANPFFVDRPAQFAEFWTFAM